MILNLNPTSTISQKTSTSWHFSLFPCFTSRTRFIERIRNKPISVRVQEYATTVFAVMLLSFMLYVTFFDIKERVPIFKELFGRETTIQEKPLSK